MLPRNVAAAAGLTVHAEQRPKCELTWHAAKNLAVVSRCAQEQPGAPCKAQHAVAVKAARRRGGDKVLLMATCVWPAQLESPLKVTQLAVQVGGRLVPRLLQMGGGRRGWG